MKLAAVIVFYNPDDNNIFNINNYIDSVDKLYVVDNSDDDIVRVEESDKIEYIKLNENKGIAYALNVGAKKAIKDDYKYLLTLDQDIDITNDNINKMKDFLNKNKDDKVGLISPYQDIDNKEDKPKGKIEDVTEVMTSGNIINLDAYQEIGGFKDWLFIDGVDTEYCLNLHKHGYKVLRLNDIVLKHNLGNKKIHKFLGKEYVCYNHSPLRRYYIVRNNLYINQLYKDDFPDHCAYLIRAQKGQVKRILLFEKNKINKLKMMYKGYKDFKKGIKGKLIK